MEPSGQVNADQDDPKEKGPALKAPEELIREMHGLYKKTVQLLQSSASSPLTAVQKPPTIPSVANRT
jgi:hypothetical protein